MTGHAKANRCYAWSFLEANATCYVAALENSACRIGANSRAGRDSKQGTKIGAFTGSKAIFQQESYRF
jgi:hypothetical protein